jgi:hypothetical protein
VTDLARGNTGIGMTAAQASRPLGPLGGGVCGTTGGRMAHRRRGEQVCCPCARAWAEYMANWRRRNRYRPPGRSR